MPDPQIRTLILTEKPVYPPMGGAAMRNWQNVNLLKQFGPVSIFYPHFERSQESNEPHVPPDLAQWTVSRAKQRNFRQKIGYRLQMGKWLLTRIDPLTNMFYCPDVAIELNQVLDSFKPDLVVIEELWLYCYLFIIKRYPCQVVYDAHNAETALFHELFSSNQKTSLRTKINNRTKLAFISSIEKDLLQKVDQVWACSEHDAHQLQHTSANPPSITVLPNTVNVAYYNSVYAKEQPLPEQLNPTPHTLIFLASFGYHPNAIAAEWLLHEIYPRLIALYPDCRLLLVGKNPSELMEEASKHNPNIVVTGTVPDVRPYLAAASIAVVPLHQGSGTRLKVLEAFACGRPVVSTSKGVEGVDAVDGIHLLIRDHAEDFVQGISCLWEQSEVGQKLAQSAYELVQTTYSGEAAAEKLKGVLKGLTKGVNSLDSNPVASTKPNA